MTSSSVRILLPPFLEPHVKQDDIAIPFEYNGTRYHYCLISSRLADDVAGLPKNFVYCSPQKGDGMHILGISDAYPEKYRVLALTHEVMEYGLTDMIMQDDTRRRSCVAALTTELFLAKRQFSDFRELKNYVHYRQRFFHDMVHWLERKQRVPLEQRQLEHMLESLKTLNDLVAIV